MVQPNRTLLSLDANFIPVQNSALECAFQGEYTPGAFGVYNLKYKGFARPGSNIDDPVWQIAYIQYDVFNNPISIEWPRLPNGVPSNNFSFIWANRNAYIYD